MYCVAYLFSVKTDIPDFENRFKECWTAISKYFQDEAGCGATHLTRTHEEGVFCAYAQWPSMELYTASRENPPRQDFMSYQMEWAELIEHTELVFEGETIVEI